MDKQQSGVSRRKLLVGGLAGGVAVTAAVLVPRVSPSASQRTRQLLASNAFTRRFLSLAHADYGEWAAQIGSTLSVAGGFSLRLAGVQPLRSTGARPAGLRDRAFVAVFDVLGGMTMPSDLIYAARHPQYGALPLFLSTTAADGRMHAVFN